MYNDNDNKDVGIIGPGKQGAGFDFEAFRKTKEYKKGIQLKKVMVEYELMLQKRYSLEELIKLEESMKGKREREAVGRQRLAHCKKKIKAFFSRRLEEVK